MGAEGDDYLTAFAGQDRLDGGAGADFMDGGTGDDIYLVDNVGDSIVEAAGQGYDYLFTTVSYTLGAGASIEYFSTADYAGTEAIDLTGNELGNSILGNAGANRLMGGGGDDYLDASGRADILDGGAGQAFLVGGSGTDTFRVTSASHSSAGDTISDFLAGTDKIDLSEIDASSKAGGNEAFSFIGTGAFTGAPGELRCEIRRPDPRLRRCRRRRPGRPPHRPLRRADHRRVRLRPPRHASSSSRPALSVCNRSIAGIQAPRLVTTGARERREALASPGRLAARREAWRLHSTRRRGSPHMRGTPQPERLLGMGREALKRGSGGAGGIRTLDTLLTYTHFPGERLRPLGHRSACPGIGAL